MIYILNDISGRNELIVILIDKCLKFAIESPDLYK